MSQQDVLVYCANGLQGHAIVPELLAGGMTVRALVRDQAQAAALAAAGAEIYLGTSRRRSRSSGHTQVSMWSSSRCLLGRRPRRLDRSC